MNRSASDIEAGRQILNIFVRSKVQAGGELRRIHFFDVRDGDFQRGIDCALMNRWIALHHRDRYRYILTAEGYAAGRQTESPATVPTTPQAATPQATTSPAKIEG
jgi:hypothetical protein